jgi:tripartite-type tricarboxylate transporter receptor subunit TctC
MDTEEQETKMKAFKALSRAIAVAALAVSTGTANAEATAANYPTKPVKVIVPLAPGGAVSGVARIFADKLGKELGQTFIVDHRPGGETLVGAGVVAQSAPDGYTLLIVSPAFAVNQTMVPNKPWDAIKDFTPVAGLVQTDWLLVTNPSVPANNLKDFLAYSKANPSKVNLSSASSIGVLIYQLMDDAVGFKFTVVNYKGQGPATTDLLSGVVQGTLTTATSSSEFIKAGKLKLLASAGTQRSPLFPQVGTFAEQGVPGFVAQSTYLMLAPAKTPPAVVEKLNAAVRKVQADPEVKALLAKLGFDAYPTTTAEVLAKLHEEIDRYGTLVRKTGLVEK